jgi:uncharacterized protein involved in response to NO
MTMRPLRLVTDPPEVVGSRPPPILAKGFRPFFLLGAVAAAVLVPLWVLALNGVMTVGGRLDPVTWHAHEMVFGFGAAVIAGFLLTAVGNWTQRETATGASLLALVVVWLAGRIVLAAGASIPPSLASAIDIAFLPCVALAVATPIVASKNRRNFIVVAMLLVMSLANAWVHFARDPMAARRALLVGVDVITFFMVVIAGRVLPMFTRNATRVETIRSLPKLDVAATLSIAAVIALDASGVTSTLARVGVYATAAALVAARTRHWGMRASFRDPLLWILHLGHAWIPVGLALRAASSATPQIPASAGLHAITAGAIGALTLGMMARVSLGHTGRLIIAPRSASIAFVLVTAAASIRVAAPIFLPEHYLLALAVTGALWGLAFAIYVVAYAPLLFAPRIDGKAG